ncbi:MAG: Cof-type HAD-IIB family hydrolase [Actinomycetota bacterium]
MVELVAIDLDGTLYDSKSRISLENKKAIAECLSRGIKVVVATGKTIYSVSRIIEELNLIHPQIVSGGTAIIDCRKNLFFKLKMPLSYSNEVVRLCRKHKKGLALSASDGIIYYEADDAGIDFIARTGDKVQKVGNLIKEGYTGNALVFTVTITAEDPFNKLVEKKLKGKAKLRRGPLFLNVLNKDAGKAFALKKIMEMFGIGSSRVVSIGDSENDMGMIKLAGTGIAMANTPLPVRQSADFVVSDNDNCEIAEAINRFVLI